jgi:hypothetical protein
VKLEMLRLRVRIRIMVSEGMSEFNGISWGEKSVDFDD